MLKKIKLKENETILIVSSLNGNFNKLDIVNDLSNKYSNIILNGNLFKNNDKYNILNDLKNNIYYCFGDKDYIYGKNKNNWHIFNYYNLYILEYNNTRYNICCGGYEKNISQLEYSFINNDNWHKQYNGNHGYYVTNYPQNSKPVFYKYSCSLGSDDYTYCQEIVKFGLQKTFII